MNKLPYLETTVKWINNNKRVNLPRSFCENWHRVDPHLSWVTHHERAFFSLSTKHQNHMKVHTMPNPKRSKLCLLNSVSSSDDTSSSLRSRCWSWRWTVFCWFFVFPPSACKAQQSNRRQEIQHWRKHCGCENFFMSHCLVRLSVCRCVNFAKAKSL